MYDWPNENGGGDDPNTDDGMKKKSSRILGKGGVAYINDSIGM